MAQEVTLDHAQAGIVTGKTTVTADIRVQGELVPWAPVTFSLDGLGTIEITQTQSNAQGQAFTRFVPPICQSGTSTITATAVIDGETITDMLTINYEGRGYYTITDLGNPGNVNTPTIVPTTSGAEVGPGLNNHGEIVFRRHILRADQPPEELPAPPPLNSFIGINITDSGRVLGLSSSNSGLSAAFFENGDVHLLPNLHSTTLGGFPMGAYAMNSHGTIAGGSMMSVFEVPPGEHDPGGHVVRPHATIWNGGAPSPLIEPRPTLNLAEGERSLAHDINDAGLIVGEYEANSADENYDTERLGRVWFGGGSFTRLPNLGPFAVQPSVGHAINNSGAIAGWARTATDNTVHPVLWLLSPAHGFPAGLHALSEAIGWAFDINDLGEVVGRMAFGTFPNGGYPYYGFHWVSGEFRNLNDLIDPESIYHILEAARVNENGQIACWANLKSDPNSYAVLLLSPAE
jgi:hypothetical protein